ncbi:phage major capsid protein [Hyphomonas oceanitis]|uniref:Phage capsid-like C-terminal domain-containing protein n=1 Tax=Hyphomonas oceanitis SCH89 TaxID=1280953 RepID=A0A059G8L6_9PROT|nr:phage major capsid protein [Hyphomonas oceanitis]KDA03069.1 hypothetical protein HOC_07829 [Hyphomonas oceanitis SCH89]
MLQSVKLQRRQSEIRQKLSELVGKDEPSTDEVREIETLDTEFRSNEIRYRAALVTENDERREAGEEIENRSDKEWSDLVDKFELRQVALYYDEGRALDGHTAEIVQELRSSGGFRGVPVPWQALEQRAGETVSSGTPDPVRTAPIIDRLFPQSVAGRMGLQMVAIESGSLEYPVTTSSVSAGWQATETGAVAGPTVYAVTDRPLAPDNTLGITMKITRKALKQSGAGLEQAIRRDMASAIGASLDQAIFLGQGSSGQPLGLVYGASTYGINETSVDAAATWAAFREAIVAFMTNNAAGAASDVRILMRPECWSALDDALISGTAVSEWDRLVKNVGAQNVVVSSNALADPAGSPLGTDAVLMTSAGGVAPGFVGLWGAVDVIRDPYSDAASGGLRLTALATADVTVARAAQSEVLQGIHN